MRRGRVFIYLALIIILGLIALVVIWQRFLVPSSKGTTTEAQPTPVVTTVNIIVLTQKVPRRGCTDRGCDGDDPHPTRVVYPGDVHQYQRRRGHAGKV